VVERQLPKLNVAGSIPVSRSNRIDSFQSRASICVWNPASDPENLKHYRPKLT
jgi:hypothetical protein